jgi:hypothetical protein
MGEVFGPLSYLFPWRECVAKKKPVQEKETIENVESNESRQNTPDQGEDVKKVNASTLYKSEDFKPDNLRMLTDGLWKYVTFEINAIHKSIFHCDLAKNYGLKKGHLVMIVDNDSVKTVVV